MSAHRMPPVWSASSSGTVWTTMVHNGRNDELACVVWHTDAFDPRRDPPYLEHVYRQLEERLAAMEHLDRWLDHRLAAMEGAHMPGDSEELLAALGREAKQYEPAPKRWVTPETIDREFGFHPATEKTGPVHEQVRERLRQVAHELNDLLPECPRKTEAIGHLRTAMWAANSAVAAYGSDSPTWVPRPRDEQPAVEVVGSVHERYLRGVAAYRRAYREAYPLTSVELAERAYGAYGDVTGWKNYRHEPMPRFVDLPDKIRQAWEAAAVTAVELGHEPARHLSDEQAASAVFEAMGAISTAWEHVEGAGAFREDAAVEVCRRLLERLGYEMPEGYLRRSAPATVLLPDPVHPQAVSPAAEDVEG